MKKGILLGMALCAMSWLAMAATANPTKKKVTKRRSHAVSASSRTTSAKSTARSGTKAKPSTTRSKATASKGAKGRKTVARSTRYRQMTPTKDRYQQIQQALASKGYFTGEANGQWGSDSVEALKRFQTDQNLTPDGKLTSLSLIALGLGPKRLSAQSAAQPSHGEIQQ